jgi:hypothetical protein
LLKNEKATERGYLSLLGGWRVRLRVAKDIQKQPEGLFQHSLVVDKRSFEQLKTSKSNQRGFLALSGGRRFRLLAME